MTQIKEIYKILKKAYGPQGWWPLVNPKTLMCEYHTGAPKNDADCFEICCGAILTQNTGWTNVEKALKNLASGKMLSVEGIREADIERLKEAIRPAGYYNQKAKKLKIFSEFFKGLKGRTPSREELLEIWGIGPETADSILLYAYREPEFVVDAYTKRIFSRIGICDEDAGYEELKRVFEEASAREVKGKKDKAKVFNEYHALIVEHAKRNCRSRPQCEDCVLKGMCKNGRTQR